ncbi:MAG: hypothetical protein JWO33_709 [Caulobacteraceae bacterium]|nr:hypothetical protein [Caulobacteraceae bacterium]
MSLNRRALIATATAAAVVSPARADGRWVEKPKVPYPIQEVYGVAWRDQVLIAGGMAPAQGQVNPTDRSALYDPAVNLWREWGRFPFPRHHPSFATVRTDRYASAGFPDAFAMGGYRVTEAGSWVSIKQVLLWDLVWTEVEPMPLFQAEAVAVGLDGIVHLVSGRAPKGESNKAYADHADVATHQTFDPEENRWRSAKPCPLARNSATGTEIDGKLYLCGGRTMGGGNTGQLDRYDPATDKWEMLRPMPQGAGGLAGAALGGKLYVFGGEGGPKGVIAETWSYDPKTDRWSPEPAMRTPRHGLAAVALGGQIYAVGGGTKPSGGAVSDICEAFVPA